MAKKKSDNTKNETRPAETTENQNDQAVVDRQEPGQRISPATEAADVRPGSYEEDEGDDTEEKAE